MKKTLMSLAILAASGAAYAQSNVTIYGIMDAGFVGEQGGKNGTVNKVSAGGLSASRLGFKGTEDLGGGLSAVFTLETGIKGDTGELDNTSNTLFNRQAFVGLSSKTAGTLTLGRQYTPWYNTLSQVADPFAAGMEGSAKNLFPAGGTNVRNSNSVVYKSPDWNGITGELFYGAGEQKGEAVGRQLGASLGYQNGPLNVRAAFNTRNGGSSATKFTDPGRNALIAANYDFKVAKVFAAFGINRGNGSTPFPNDTAYTSVAVPQSTDNRIWLVGATVPVSAAGTVVASWTQVEDHSSLDHDAKQAAIGYLHALSKRTTAYASVGKVGNRHGGSYTVGNNADVGTGHKGYGVGIRHMF